MASTDRRLAGELPFELTFWPPRGRRVPYVSASLLAKEKHHLNCSSFLFLQMFAGNMKGQDGILGALWGSLSLKTSCLEQNI